MFSLYRNSSMHQFLFLCKQLSRIHSLWASSCRCVNFSPTIASLSPWWLYFFYLEITSEWWCSFKLWRLMLYALAAWSLWSSWLHSVWDWSAPLPECILQWHDWGCRGWRLTQCWICFPYYPWNCTSWSLWIVGIWPGSAAVEGNPVFQALKFPFLREIYVPSVNMSCSAFNKP